jgi:hypothetical protein
VDRLIDEDWELRKSLAACDPAWVGELEFVLNAPETYRSDLRRLVAARPNLADLGELLAMADANEVVRLRLLRAIRDAENP